MKTRTFGVQVMRRWIGTVLTVVLLTRSAGALAQDTKAVSEPGTHMNVQGIVHKIQGDVIFAKTPWGQIAIGTAKKLKNIAVGDEVILWVNEDNSVIEVHRKGASRPHHRLITGHLVYTTAAKNEIKLWTPEGAKTFPVDDSVIARLNAISEGAPVTVEVTEDRRVVDLHSLTLTVEVNTPQLAHPGRHLRVTGTVAKVREPLVFVKTPFGQSAVTKATGLHDAKPGDKVVLWVDENNLVADVKKDSGTVPAKRVITGKLNYTSAAQDEIKFGTPEGTKSFGLQQVRDKVTRLHLKEGELITAEVNASGQVLDIKKAENEGATTERRETAREGGTP